MRSFEDMTIMLTRPILLAALPAVLLGGCTGTKNRGLESVHQPVVSRTDYAFDVNVGPRGLAPGESQRLAGWLASMRLGYGDKVAVDDPTHASATQADVAAQAARFGLLLSDAAPVTGAPLAPGTARVVVSRARAFVPGCPDWSRTSGIEFESNTNSNHGCATNATLAAMVADPMDLVRGASRSGVYDPDQATKAIDIYRKAAPSGGGGTVVKSEGVGGK